MNAVLIFIFINCGKKIELQKKQKMRSYSSTMHNFYVLANVTNVILIQL